MTKLSILVLALLAFCLIASADLSGVSVKWSTTIKNSYKNARVPELWATKHIKDVPLEFSIVLADMTVAPEEYSLQLDSSYIFPSTEAPKCTLGSGVVPVVIAQKDKPADGSFINFDISAIPASNANVTVVCSGFISPSNTPTKVTNAMKFIHNTSKEAISPLNSEVDDIAFNVNQLNVEITPAVVPLFTKTQVTISVTPHTLYTPYPDDNQMNKPHFNLHFNDYNNTRFVQSIDNCLLRGESIKASLMNMADHRMQMVYWSFDVNTFFKKAGEAAVITCDVVFGDVKTPNRHAPCTCGGGFKPNGGGHHGHGVDEDGNFHPGWCQWRRYEYLATPDWSCIMGSKSSRHTYFAPILTPPSISPVAESEETPVLIVDVDFPAPKKKILDDNVREVQNIVYQEALPLVEGFLPKNKTMAVKFLKNESKNEVNSMSFALTFEKYTDLTYATLGRGILYSPDFFNNVNEKVSQLVNTDVKSVNGSASVKNIKNSCFTDECGADCFLCENQERCTSSEDCLFVCRDGSCGSDNSSVVVHTLSALVLVLAVVALI